MMSPHSWPQAIIHLDGDAFFASCEQAMHPEWKGRPVVTGKERGIVAAASYEAKAQGVSRGVALWDVKKRCPDAIIVPSDYESYSLFSKRMFAVMRRFTSLVEEYSIDEGFAEITGLRRALKGKYSVIAQRIKEEVEKDLGITVSVGVSLSKTLAKIGSNWDKPSGCTAISGRHIPEFLGKLSAGKVWGIGPATAAYCRQFRIETALDFANQTEEQVRERFTKPHFQTWQELNGISVMPVETEEKTSYASVSKTKTFTPPSADPKYVWAQLLKNLENACIKCRRHGLVASRMVIYLVAQGYKSKGMEADISRPTAFPIELAGLARQMFERVLKSGTEYRATGVVLSGLSSGGAVQLGIFDKPAQIDRLTRLYEAVDDLSARMGKHCIRTAAAQAAHVVPQHVRDRGDVTWRKQNRLPGESGRKHIGLPVLDPIK